MTQKTDPSTKPIRARLNREIITLKKNQVLEGVKVESITSRKCRKKDPTGMPVIDEKGQPVWEEVALVNFMDKRGIGVSHFMNGGLKNALNGIPKDKFLDIECLGKKEFKGANGQPAVVNDYAIYAAE